MEKIESSRGVWDWQRDAGALQQRALRRRTRLMGLLQGTIAGGIGAGLLALGHAPAGLLVLTLGAATAAAALLSPMRAYARLQRFTAMLGIRIGRAMSWLLLAPVFYLFFAPFGLLLRRERRDRLERRFEPELPTYWKKRAISDPTPSRYERLS